MARIALRNFLIFSTNNIKRVASLLTFSLAIPIVVVIRIVRPIVLLRFGPIRSDVIGHAVWDPVYYLMQQQVTPSNSVDCFFFSRGKHPNNHWKKMIERNFVIHRFFRTCDLVNRQLPGGNAHIVKLIGKEVDSGIDRSGLLAKTTVEIRFTDEEEKEGKRYLERCGMQGNDLFICLIARDGYYKNKYQRHIKRDWSYSSYRDVDINSLNGAMLALAEKGYWVFRMGKGAEKRLSVKHPRIVDYALSDDRSDFLDIWLMAKTFFGISTGTGIDAVSTVYRRPVVYVDYIPIHLIVSCSQAITVPKLVYWESDGTPLSLNECLTHNYQRSEHYENEGIIVEELSSDQKREVVLEMEARLTSSWTSSDEDAALQEQFWETIRTGCDYLKNHHGVIHPEARLGAAFLRKYGEWYLARNTKVLR